MNYICTETAYHTDKRGNVTVYKPGDTITTAKYKNLKHTVASKFRISGNTITTDSLLEAIMAYHDAGEQLVGDYKAVWYQLMLQLDEMGYATAKYVGYRTTHIAQAGRAYQVATGDRFDELCPDLRQHASDWVNW